ncbi:flavodoxin family protein [candidate division KSB1 bacterium]|nr:flavodoxin family protein [candidate division KSB1 bacterium]
MKILIFDGCKNNGIKNLAGLLPNESEVINIHLSEQNILNCTGCMSCVWNMEKMNPGYCRLNDDMKLIYPTFIHSDLVIFMTDILFGGFSFQLKKVIDRLLSALFTAPLKKRGNDVGHIMRYKKRPAILGIGIQKEKDQEMEDIFKEYIDRLSTLWDVPYNDSLVYALNSDSEFNEQLIKNKIENWVNTLL